MNQITRVTQYRARKLETNIQIIGTCNIFQEIEETSKKKTVWTGVVRFVSGYLKTEIIMIVTQWLQAQWKC